MATLTIPEVELPAFRKPTNFSVTSELAKKASRLSGVKPIAYSHTLAQAIPTALVSAPATVAEIADPAMAPPGTNFKRLVTAYRPAMVAPPVNTTDPAMANARVLLGGNP